MDQFGKATKATVVAALVIWKKG